MEEILEVDELHVNKKIVDILGLIACYYKISTDKHRAIAFTRASNAISKYPYKIVSSNQVKDIKYVGKSTVDIIDEYLLTGSVSRLQELETVYADRKNCISEFIKYFGIGPETAFKYYNAGYRKIEDLVERGKLTNAQRLGIMWHNEIDKRIDRSEIDVFKDIIINLFSPYGIKFDIAGSYRRGEETSGDIDLLIQYKTNLTIDFIVSLMKDYMVGTLASGDTKFMGILRLSPSNTAHRIDILMVKSISYPFALMYFTGSDAYNILMRRHADSLGFTLNENGLSKKGKEGNLIICNSEEDICKFLNVSYLEPSLRCRNLSFL